MSQTISAKHRQFIYDYANNIKKTHGDFANDFNVTETTISKWVKKYQQEIDDEITNKLKKVKDLALKYANEAFKVQVDLMKNAKHETVKHQASKLVLEIVGVKEENINLKHENGLQIILEGVGDINSEQT